MLRQNYLCVLVGLRQTTGEIMRGNGGDLNWMKNSGLERDVRLTRHGLQL